MKRPTSQLLYRILIVWLIACTLLSAFFLYQGYKARQQQAKLQANVDHLVNIIKGVEPTKPVQLSLEPAQTESATGKVVGFLIEATVLIIFVVGLIKLSNRPSSKPVNAPKPAVIRDTKNDASPLGLLMTAVMVMFLIRCQMQEPAAPNAELKDSSYIVQQQDSIRDKLKDPDSADFKNSFVSRLIGVPIVCGYVNAKNGFGGYGGFERFISGGGIQVVESQMAEGEMSKSWGTVCSSK